MSMVAFIPKKCAVCGNENEDVQELIDAVSFGPMDLDTRPAENLRSALPYLIQQCSFCGYCNSDISEAVINDRSLLETEEYKSIISDDDLPEAARKYLASAHLLHKTGNLHRSAIESLHAAWVFDDLGDINSSMGARLGAVISIRAQLQECYDENLAVILLDILRRSEQFDLCMMIAQSIRDMRVEDEFVKSIIDYQVYLAQNIDSSCKTVADVDIWEADKNKL